VSDAYCKGGYPKRGGGTFLVLWQAKVHIPAWDKNHVISQVFALDLGLLNDDNVCLEGVEHGLGCFRGGVPPGRIRSLTYLKCTVLPPWLI